ncbi:MarR family winged helix-turn-helix transcriptional regulator [Actinopolyspora halophila]|uniref:MarR family winged helix-turn-helix transcriptional regulator n=1 Tax=Actinopolyspora halophila TaxID=1850 RepID=UPI000361A146|nr:MarR family transcriptional regulator [Actinopolyspora halophila]
MNADRGASTGQRELATVLRDLAWTIQRLVPEVTGLDPLTNTELAAIKHIQESPGITVTELARQLGMQQSNASAAVRDLVERDLVAREHNPTDRRVTRLVPTERSLAAKDSIDTVWSGTIRTALSRLDHDQVATLHTASGALRALDQALHAERPASRSDR